MYEGGGGVFFYKIISVASGLYQKLLSYFPSNEIKPYVEVRVLLHTCMGRYYIISLDINHLVYGKRLTKINDE